MLGYACGWENGIRDKRNRGEDAKVDQEDRDKRRSKDAGNAERY